MRFFLKIDRLDEFYESSGKLVRLVLPLYPAELTVGYFAAYSLSTSVASASVVEIR